MELTHFRSAGMSTKTPGKVTVFLGVVLCSAVAGLIVLSYQSVREWRTASELLADQRAEVVLTLLSNALNQDMKGAQVSVLLPLESADLVSGLPDDLRDTFARAFPRFPYAESFFTMRPSSAKAVSFYLFNRLNRPPVWEVPSAVQVTYPVTVEKDPVGARPLIQVLRQHADGPGRFIVFNWTVRGVDYQVVAKRLFARTGTVAGFVGFTVNLRWTRDNYFGELAQEVSKIDDATRSASITIADEEGRTVASTQRSDFHGPVRHRQFPLLFFDRVMLSALAPGTHEGHLWTATVEAVNDPAILAATQGTYGTYVLLALTAIACVVGMLLTARAIRASAELAAMQLDFTSTVTHELKTPLTSIRLLGETLSNDRHHSTETIRDYARMLSQEAWRLTRLIDNLLTYARVPSVQPTIPVEMVDVLDLVDETLEHFRPQLVDQRFEVIVDVPTDLPHIQGDRFMLSQALENLVDNAIKYSGERHTLSIRSWAKDHRLFVEVADHGSGIVPEEIPRVFEKFYRGRTVRSGGSGLGLAIVKRVMEDHHGTVEVRSVLREGTSLRLILPMDTDSA
jgi:signal transduction histidine kinase